MAQSLDNTKILSDAVGRNAAIVLSLPSAGLVRHFKTRFLGDCDRGLWIESTEGSAGMLQDLLNKQHPLAVSFNVGSRRLSFATTVVEFNPSHQINADTTIAAVLVAPPQDLKGVQRRHAYRVRVQNDGETSVRIWIIPEHAQLQDRPMASQEVNVDVVDISIGGVGVRILPTEKTTRDPQGNPKNQSELPRLANDQRLRVQLRHKEQELLLDARYRPAPGNPKAPDAPGPPAGAIFKKLENDVEGRQKLAILTRIVGEMQREEVRRMRLGMAS